MPYLLIVESPGKIKKIQSFLGDDDIVLASVGHICDLPIDGTGVDKNNNYNLRYKVSKDKVDVVSRLKAAVAKVGKENVVLATDDDREGEAIAYHLIKELDLSSNTKRIKFNAITKESILKAINKPVKVDMDLVKAQEVRRALDYLIGFEISPVLWKKLGSDFKSAGRVQSVACGLVVDLEKEIEKFSVSKKFKGAGVFSIDGKNIKGRLNNNIESKEEALKLAELFKSNDEVKVKDVKFDSVESKPQPPFTASSLQMDASKILKFGIKKTMDVAQKLYEKGFISYMRTDSVHLDQSTIEKIKMAVIGDFGAEYFKERIYKNKDAAQEAHEGIVPLYFDRDTSELNDQEKALYGLIRNRAMACQMSSKKINKTTVEFEFNTEVTFTSVLNVVTFDGFEKAYKKVDHDATSEKDEEEVKINFEVGSALNLSKVVIEEKLSAPPKRFNQARLVRELEKKNIGRPSTYASIMESIITYRKYLVNTDIDSKNVDVINITIENGNISESSKSKKVGKEKDILVPSDVAIKLVEFLQSNTPLFMDYQFTNDCEVRMDKIAQGKENNLLFLKEIDTSLSHYISTINEKYKDVNVNVDLGGSYKDSIIQYGTGKYGKYLKWNDKYFPYKSDEEPTRESAIDYIEAILNKPKDELIHDFEKLKVYKGQYGYYFKVADKFVSIPKWENKNVPKWTFDAAKKIYLKQKNYKPKQKKVVKR